MGSSSSKASQAAAGAAARQYPKRVPPTSNLTTNKQANEQASSIRPGPTVKATARASSSRDAAINLDASDPDFARQLRSIGPVQPNPTLSSTSTFNSANASQSISPHSRAVSMNPALRVLDARASIQEQADREFAEAGKNGRSLVDVYTIRQILVQRDEGRSAAEIEKALSLKQGVVERLGPEGMVALITEVGRAKKEIDMV